MRRSRWIAAMPCEVRYEHGGAGAVVVATGVVSAADIRAVNDEIYSDAHVYQLRYQLCDFTRAAELDFTEADVRQFAMQDYAASRKNGRQVVALVGPQAFLNGWAALYGVYQKVWSGFASDFFVTIPEARRWIAAKCPDLDGPAPQPGT